MTALSVNLHTFNRQYSYADSGTETVQVTPLRRI